MSKDQIISKLFTDAHTFYAWEETQVEDSLLKNIYDAAKWGPTSFNCQPLRVVFVKSQASKEKLLGTLMEGNVEKTKQAPVTAILAYDYGFVDNLHENFPVFDARGFFKGNHDLTHETAFRNGNLSAAYFIIAARAYGLDCGPMSGFDNAKVDELFLKDKGWKSNFLCNLGYGKKDSLPQRFKRHEFDEVCAII